jgi:Domain of unknown function (DUF4402)
VASVYRRLVGTNFACLMRQFWRPVVVPLALLAATPSYAQSFSSTGTATASIVETLGLTNTVDLEFGTIIPASTAGSVTVTPTGLRTATGGVVLVGTGFHPAEFAGRGARRNQQISISFGAVSIILRKVGDPTKTMIVDTFRLGAPPSASLAPVAASTRFRIVPVNLIYDFPVGATLRVGANQSQGVYEGTFKVTVEYR